MFSMGMGMFSRFNDGTAAGFGAFEECALACPAILGSVTASLLAALVPPGGRDNNDDCGELDDELGRGACPFVDGAFPMISAQEKDVGKKTSVIMARCIKRWIFRTCHGKLRCVL